jgi:hypothetical protein
LYCRERRISKETALDRKSKIRSRPAVQMQAFINDLKIVAQLARKAEAA